MHRSVEPDPLTSHREPQDGEPGGCPCVCSCTCSCSLGDQAATQPSNSSQVYGRVASDMQSIVPHTPGG